LAGPHTCAWFYADLAGRYPAASPATEKATVLAWRDELALHGWSSKITEGRLADLAAVDEPIRDGSSSSDVRPCVTLVQIDHQHRLSALQIRAWCTPGFWSISLEFVAIVVLESPIVVSGRETSMHGCIPPEHAGGGVARMGENLDKGLGEFIKEVQGSIRAPDATSGGS